MHPFIPAASLLLGGRPAHQQPYDIRRQSALQGLSARVGRAGCQIDAVGSAGLLLSQFGARNLHDACQMIG